MSDFGRTKKEAKRNYQDFVEKVDVKALENPSRPMTEEFLLGDADFVDWVKETFLAGIAEEVLQNRRLRHRLDGIKRRIFKM